MKKVHIQEQGWAAHFCCAHNCGFRRNTLIRRDEKAFIVSTVGNYRFIDSKTQEWIYDSIGCDNRQYETCVFPAMFDGVYWEPEIDKEISVESVPCSICSPKIERRMDAKANIMHDNMVAAISNQLRLGTL